MKRLNYSVLGDDIDLSKNNSSTFSSSITSEMDEEEITKVLESNKISILERLSIINERVLNVLGKQKRNVQIITTKEELKEYFDNAFKAGRIDIDTETDNSLDPITCKLMGPCFYYPGGKQAYVPLNHRNPISKKRLDTQLTEKDVAEQLQRIVDSRKKWTPEFEGQSYLNWWIEHVYKRHEECPSPLVVMHNGKFDYEVIKCTCGVALPVDWDTMIAHRIIDENDLAGLKYLYTTKVDRSQSKYDIDKLFTNVFYADVDPNIFSLYAATDSMMTDKVFMLQIEYLIKPEQIKLLWLFMNIEMPIVIITAEQELIGIKVDVEFFDRLKEKYNKLLSEVDSEINKELESMKEQINQWKLSVEANEKVRQYVPAKTSLTREKIQEKYPLVDNEGNRYKLAKPKVEQIKDPIELSSPTQLAILLYDILKCPIVDKKNPRGTGEDIIKELNERMGLNIFKLILKRRGIMKLLTSYIATIPVLAKHWPDGRVRFHLNQLGTDTGRFSSGGRIAYNENDERVEINGINIQQLPSKYTNIRNAFMGETTYNEYTVQSSSLTINEYEELKTTNGYKYPRDLAEDDKLISESNNEIPYENIMKINKKYTIGFGSSINETFKTRTRRRIVGSDYSAQEPRLTCFISQDEHMLNAYLEGKDLYAVISSRALKNKYEENLEFWPEGTELEIDGKKVIAGYKTHKNLQGKANRNLGKLLLLASTYGMSGATAGANMGKSAKEGQELLDSFFAGFKKVKEAIDFSKVFLKENGYVEDWAGRRRHLKEYFLDPYEITYIDKSKVISETFNPLIECEDRPLINAKMSAYLEAARKTKGAKEFEELQKKAEKDGFILTSNTGKIAQAERQCFNARIQGGAASLTKLAMINIYNDEELRSYGAHLICSVHDEILVECLDYYNKEVEKRLPEIMINCPKKYINVPMKCDPYNVYRWYADETANHILDEYKSLIKEGKTNEEARELIYEDNSEYLVSSIDDVLDLKTDQITW